MASTLAIIRTVPELRRLVRRWRAAGDSVGLVPTMGALHDGHLALVRAAQARCRRVVVTIFVNPKQFERAEDLATYPRTEDEDAAKLAALGVDLLFVPRVEAMYPAGFATTVSVGDVGATLEGAARPGHFDGVATVVTKLLLQTLPDAAFFGEKDYQQLQVVRRLAADLDIPVDIVGIPTVRDRDGLALASRNVHLSAAEREAAPALHRALQEAAQRLRAGASAAAAIDAAQAILAEAGFGRIDYLAVCTADALRPVERLTGPCRILAAAWLGKTRLIDNIGVERG